MPDEPKQKEEKIEETASKPEEKVEEKTAEPEVKEDSSDEKAEAKEEKPAEEKPKETKKQKTKKYEEKPKKKTKKTEKPAEQKKTKAEPKKDKAEPKKEASSKSKDKKDDDFQYIVRISNTDIDGDKNIVYGLTSIKGIGMQMATIVMKKTGLDRNLKMGKLSESQIKKLQDAIDSISQDAPAWMLNHRKDYETGEDIHLIGSEIDLKLRDEINIMKKIRSYRGIRHERGLPVRGQRTRANNRKGLTLGVSKKRNQIK